MDNQHQKIQGYRELSQQEIDLMNRIKDHAEKAANLLKEVYTLRRQEQDANLPPLTPKQFKESVRCLSVAKTKLQTGQMWFVRAVALPDSF